MITHNYPDASCIPEKYIKNLVLPQIQCWGSEPHGEYKICSDEGCRRVISIEEIHGKKGQNKVHNEVSDTFVCPECQCNTEYIYDTEKYLGSIKEYISSKVSIVLLTTEEDEEITGFGVTSRTNIESVSELEFATRVGSYDVNELKKELSQKIFGCPDAQTEDLVLFHQIYVSPESRNPINTFKLLRNLFNQTPENGSLPVVIETRYDGNFYPISRSMGFQNVINDKYGYVTQYTSSYDNILEFLHNNQSGYRNFISSMRKFKGEAQRIISQNPHFSEPLFYS